MFYEDLVKKVKKERKLPVQESLPCDTCDCGGGAAGRAVRDNHAVPAQIFCTVMGEQEIAEQACSKSCWIPVTAARICKGPDHLRERIVRNFMRGDASLTPPDS